MPALYQSPFFYERTFFICPEFTENVCVTGFFY